MYGVEFNQTMLQAAYRGATVRVRHVISLFLLSWTTGGKIVIDLISKHLFAIAVFDIEGTF